MVGKIHTLTKESKATESEDLEYEDVLKKIGVGRVQWAVIFACGMLFLMATNDVVGMGIIAIACKCDFDLSSVDKGFLTVASFVGVGRVHMLVLVVCGLNFLMSINDVVGVGIIAIACKCDFSLNSVDKGYLTGAGLLGNILSSYFWGFVSDTVGRRPVLITTVLATNIVTLISIFIPNFWVFIFFRFCIGLSISGAINISYVYLGEFFTAQYRPIVINYASLFVALSVLFVPAVSWLVLLMDWSLEINANFYFRPWRLLPILFSLPGMLSLLSLYYLPESPKMLFTLGETEKAYASLDWICKTNHKGRSYDEVVGSKVKPFERNDNEGKIVAGKKINCSKLFSKMWNDFYPLFQRPLVGNFVLCTLIICSVYMSYIGVSLWFPEIQNSLRLYSSDENKLKSCEALELSSHNNVQNSTFLECNDRIEDKTYIDLFIYGGTCVVGYAIQGLLIKIFGRKQILIAFLGLAGVLGVSLLWIVEPFGIVMAFSLFLLVNQLATSIASGVIMEIVPTRLCGQAVCICLMFGRLSSVFATNVISATIQTHCMLTFVLLSGYSIVCSLLALFLPI